MMVEAFVHKFTLQYTCNLWRLKMGCGALPVNVCFGDETAQPLQTCKYIVSSHFDAFNVEVPVIFMKTNGVRS